MLAKCKHTHSPIFTGIVAGYRLSSFASFVRTNYACVPTAHLTWRERIWRSSTMIVVNPDNYFIRSCLVVNSLASVYCAAATNCRVNPQCFDQCVPVLPKTSSVATRVTCAPARLEMAHHQSGSTVTCRFCAHLVLLPLPTQECCSFAIINQIEGHAASIPRWSVKQSLWSGMCVFVVFVLWNLLNLSAVT